MTNSPLGIADLSSLFDAGRYKDVMLRAGRAIEAGDLHPDLLMLLAGVMLNTGWIAPAASVMEEALAFLPHDSLVLLNAALFLQNSAPARAGAYLQRFFEITHEQFPGAGALHVLKLSPVVAFDHWRNGQDIHELEPSEDVRVSDPYDGAQYGYRSAPVLSAKISSATVIPGWDFVVLSTGEVLNGCSYQDIGVRLTGVGHLYSSELARVIHPWPRHCIDVDEDALFVSAPARNHFGHWVSDFLPRLRAWRLATGSTLKIAVPKSLTQHQRDTLTMFGVREKDIVWCEIGHRYRFRSLTVVNHGNYYAVGMALGRFLYRYLGPNADTAPKKPILGRHFYLERSGTTRGRCVENQDELTVLLQDLNFEWVRRPDVPVPQQNMMLQEAGIVLTVYGSDVWALYQLRPGTDLVVLFFEDSQKLDTASATLNVTALCAALGIRLHRVFCRGAAATAERAGYRRDVVVDCAALQECLYGIIECRSLAYAESWGSAI